MMGCKLMEPGWEAARIVAADAASIAEAGRLLRCGRLVGMPTETVYGLAGDATDSLAVASIFEAKGRPTFNPLIAHVADLTEARRHGVFDDRALRLAEAFWPGPLTLVVPLRDGSPISELARAGLPTIALRVPSHPVALDLIRAAGRPLAAPSANRSGRVSPTTASHVRAELGSGAAMILDGGPCDIGVESTVIACVDGKMELLRPGGVTRDDVLRASAIDGNQYAPAAVEDDDQTRPRAPGMLLAHYAPLAILQINVLEPGPADAILNFGSRKFVRGTGSGPMIDLSPSGDLRQAASRLFAALRELDEQKPAVISVAPIPDVGLGEAINDRLRRAAAAHASLRSK
jgi:L-threonylcarbamoyladenylate synthase